MEELSSLLARFKVDWEQNVLLGDHRWERENMETMQRLAKHLSTELLEFDSKYPDLSDTEVRDRMHLLSTELRQFVKLDMQRVSIQEVEVMVAHGRTAYELTNGLVSLLRSKATLAVL